MKVNILEMAKRTAVWATQVRRPMVRLGCGAAAILPFLAATSVSAQQPGDTVRVSGALVAVGGT